MLIDQIRSVLNRRGMTPQEKLNQIELLVNQGSYKAPPTPPTYTTIDWAVNTSSMTDLKKIFVHLKDLTLPLTLITIQTVTLFGVKEGSVTFDQLENVIALPIDKEKTIEHFNITVCGRNVKIVIAREKKVIRVFNPWDEKDIPAITLRLHFGEMK